VRRREEGDPPDDLGSPDGGTGPEDVRPTFTGLTRQVAGPLVVIAAGAFLLASALLAITGREDVRRPELRGFEAPEGATVRYVDERCPSPHTDISDIEGTTVCDVVLAVGPLEGLWIPEPTEDLLLQHLAERGWGGEEVALGEWLEGPDGILLARIESYVDVRARDPELGAAIAEGVRDHVDVDELAVVVVLPAA
jgi:hypothetical protein